LSKRLATILLKFIKRILNASRSHIGQNIAKNDEKKA